MGHYCRICGRVRANEAFSAKGHQRHVCRRCWPLAAEFDADEEVLNFLRQSRIGANNIARLRQIAASGDSKRAEWAAAILEVALVYSWIGSVEPTDDEHGPSAGPVDDEMPLTDGPLSDLPSEGCEADEES